MTDITKCAGRRCTLRKNCARYRIESTGKYQSWAGFEMYRHENSRGEQACPHFVKYWESSVKRSLRR